MARCPGCNAEIATGAKICVSCGFDLSGELEATKLSDDRKSREPTEVMADVHQTSPTGGFAPGTVLAGRYRLMTSIGKGGMGEVYKADDLELNQTVALKFLPAAIAKDETALKRFRGEVRNARQVAHANVCRVFDIAEAEGVYFITMEYIEGDDLSMLLRRIGRLPSDKAVEIARQLCLGLHAIHDAGILHRDLKPANIIIDSRGKARITDFGIAGVESELTGADTRSGTPAYMSPEQINGEGVTQKSDIYSLGLLLYEIFTGKQAIQFESLAELLLKHQTSTPTNPSEILKDIDPLVEKTILQCLEKDPEDRPKNALQVALMLPGGNPLEAAIAAGETPSPAMVAAAPKKGAISPKTAMAALAGVLIGIVIFTILSDKMHIRLPEERSGEVLAARAESIAFNLGYTEKPVDTRSEFGSESNFLRYAEKNPDAVSEPVGMMKTGRFGRTFRYRQSPIPIVPGYGTRITYDDPPLSTPGMIRIETDATGRLTALHAVPSPKTDPSGEKKQTDWNRLFVEAGLDPAKYKPAPPEIIPPVFGDENVAWIGPHPSDPNITMRVEAAAFDGKPVYFRIATPWDDGQWITFGSGPPIAFQVIVLVIVALIFIGIAVLSFHNFRTGLGDLRGSLRVMAFFLAGGLLSGLILAHHVTDLWGETGILRVTIRNSTFFAIFVGLLYSALEPQIRRVWPELLISWSRLLTGGFRDPMVGRDILLGVLLGVFFLLTSAFVRYFEVLYGTSSRTTGLHFGPYEGIFSGAAHIIGAVGDAVTGAFSLLFLVLIFIFLFRRRWAGIVGIGSLIALILFALAPSEGDISTGLILSLLLAGIVMLAIARYGVLGMASFILALLLLASQPPTFERASIYFAVSALTFATLAAIAIYAAYTSTGGQLFDMNKLLGADERK